MRMMRALLRPALAALTLPLAAIAGAGLPAPVARAFAEQHIPLAAVSAYVQELGTAQPVFSHQPRRPMSPASTMKLVTTFAGLELLRPEYRWKTEAYADGTIAGGVLEGNLVLKGYGDPKITIEQFQDLIARLRATGLSTIRGDLIVDRSYFAPMPYDPGAFDAEPLRPYNVGPDALLVNFKSVRFAFAPNAARNAVEVRTEPALPMSRCTARRAYRRDVRRLEGGLVAAFDARDDGADVSFGGEYPVARRARMVHRAARRPALCAGRLCPDVGRFRRQLRGDLHEGRAPRNAQPIAVPIAAALRRQSDISKLSNNVMARQSS
jgi:D-alanyl-D-alanine carboxypeptidase/D-alanyl-D-alanine-endopeptidase (penicillin-binding protein 4)